MNLLVIFVSDLINLPLMVGIFCSFVEILDLRVCVCNIKFGIFGVHCCSSYDRARNLVRGF